MDKSAKQLAEGLLSALNEFLGVEEEEEEEEDAEEKKGKGKKKKVEEEEVIVDEEGEEEESSDDEDEDSEDEDSEDEDAGDDEDADEDSEDEGEDEDADEDADEESEDEDSEDAGDEEPDSEDGDEEEEVSRSAIAKEMVDNMVKDKEVTAKTAKAHLEKYFTEEMTAHIEKDASKLARWPEIRQVRLLQGKKKFIEAYTKYIEMMVDDEGEVHEWDQVYTIKGKGQKSESIVCNGVPVMQDVSFKSDLEEGEVGVRCTVSGKIFAVTKDPFTSREIKKAATKKKGSKEKEVVKTKSSKKTAKKTSKK